MAIYATFLQSTLIPIKILHTDPCYRSHITAEEELKYQGQRHSNADDVLDNESPNMRIVHFWDYGTDYFTDDSSRYHYRTWMKHWSVSETLWLLFLYYRLDHHYIFIVSLMTLIYLPKNHGPRITQLCGISPWRSISTTSNIIIILVLLHIISN